MNEALQMTRSALSGRRAWLVGGAVRDHVLGRDTADLDVVIDGDPAQAARALAHAAGGAACFQLSQDFAAWRVVARAGQWQIDLEGLRGGSLQADLALRDFTVNAIAEPLGGGDPIDPLGGLGDLAARRLRMASDHAFSDDPLRVLRLVRVAVELDLEAEAQTVRHARLHASALDTVAAERIFTELRRIVGSPDPLRGLELMDEVGITPVVLPELDDLRGVVQSRYHHSDVHGHTLEVLEQVISITADPGAVLGARHAEELGALLAEPVGDDLTRAGALRWGALLHDIAKPITREVRDGRVTFIGHDTRGAPLAHQTLSRLRASTRLRSHVAALVEHHLHLGFLIHEPKPLTRRTVYRYLRACEPVGVDVTLLSVADRLATRGEGSAKSIEAHLLLAQTMLTDALRWRSAGRPTALLSGDDLTRELGIAPGQRIGELLEELAQAHYAGETTSRDQALARARALAGQTGP
ncbi:MAG TPA: HDIG domain-containing protein [Solirubrobacteraceae bacterium]|jgi:putative nucleotidyltransferase with HDIG domain